MNVHSSRILIFSSPFCLGLLINMAIAAPPTQDDVSIYSALCKTGSLSQYDLNAEASLIGRRLLSGGTKLSAEELKVEPGIKDEKNRIFLIQSLQDCMYRYVERFHPRIEPDKETSSLADKSQLAPSVPPERRREIVYLANQIESFKKIMGKHKEEIPMRYYDTRDSTEKHPRDDTRLLDLENYNRYKAFQTPSGIPDFSNVTKGDVAIICDTYSFEVDSYRDFRRVWVNTFKLNDYIIPDEVRRICRASKS